MKRTSEQEEGSNATDMGRKDAFTKMDRRSFLATATAATVATGRTVFGRDFGPTAPPVRYPDPDIVILDKRFKQYKLGNTPSNGSTRGAYGRKGRHGTV